MKKLGFLRAGLPQKYGCFCLTEKTEAIVNQTFEPSSGVTVPSNCTIIVDNFVLYNKISRKIIPIFPKIDLYTFISFEQTYIKSFIYIVYFKRELCFNLIK